MPQNKLMILHLPCLSMLYHKQNTKKGQKLHLHYKRTLDPKNNLIPRWECLWIEARSGELKLMNSILTGGTIACHVSLASVSPILGRWSPETNKHFCTWKWMVGRTDLDPFGTTIHFQVFFSVSLRPWEQKMYPGSWPTTVVNGPWMLERPWILWKFCIAENSLPKSILDFGNNATDDTDQDLHYMCIICVLSLLFIVLNMCLIIIVNYVFILFYYMGFPKMMVPPNHPC